MQGQDAEKLLSQWKKVSKCDFKSKAQVYERCFFLIKWNVICNARRDFHVLELFRRASHVRASMHRITSLELLRTLMLCFVQLSKWRECKATDAESFFLSERKLLNAILRVMLLHGTDAEKLLSQWEKVAKCNFKSKAQVHEGCFFLMKLMLFALQKTDFHVLELFGRASHLRASMHWITNLELLRTLMLCLVQLSKWRECKATDAEKLLSQWKLLNAILWISSSTWNAILELLLQGHAEKLLSQWEKVA